MWHDVDLEGEEKEGYKYGWVYDISSVLDKSPRIESSPHFSAATPMYPLLSDLRSEATSDLISTQMVELYLYFIDTGTGFERIWAASPVTYN